MRSLLVRDTPLRDSIRVCVPSLTAVVSSQTHAGALVLFGPMLSARNTALGGLTRRTFLSTAPAAALLALKPKFLGQRGLPFLVVGDWGRNGKAWQRQVAEQMGRVGNLIDSRLTVSTGDNFYNLGVMSPLGAQWHTSFERIYTDPVLHRPWYAVLGNHDYGGDVTAQIQRSNYSARWRMPARWYCVKGAEFGEPSVDMFFIDTVVWRGREDFPYRWLGSSLHPADREVQRQWLADALCRSSAPVRLVFGHHPIYSVGKHGGAYRMGDLDDIIRAGGVTAYVCGHDHCLYHIEHAGMDYICSGGGSEELPHFTGDPRTWGCVLPGDCGGNRPVWRSWFPRAGFAAFIAGEHGVDFTFVDRTGATTPFLRISPRSPELREQHRPKSTE